MTLLELTNRVVKILGYCVLRISLGFTATIYYAGTLWFDGVPGYDLLYGLSMAGTGLMLAIVPWKSRDHLTVFDRYGPVSWLGFAGLLAMGTRGLIGLLIHDHPTVALDCFFALLIGICLLAWPYPTTATEDA